MFKNLILLTMFAVSPAFASQADQIELANHCDCGHDCCNHGDDEPCNCDCGCHKDHK